MDIVSADVYSNMHAINSLLEEESYTRKLGELQEMPYSHMKYLIKFGYNNFAKEFFDKTYIIDNIEYMKDAIKYDNVDMVHFFYKNRTRIPKDAILTAILGKYTDMIEWLFNHNAHYTSSILTCAINLGHTVQVNLIRNLELRKRIDISNESYNDILTNYIGIENFVLDYSVLKDQWSSIRYSIIVIGSAVKEYGEIIKAITVPVFSDFHTIKLIEILTSSFNNSYDSFDIFDNFLHKGYLKDIERVVKSYFINNISSSCHLFTIPVTSICNNLISCNKLKNKPLNHDDWKQVLLDLECNNIIYRSIDGHGYIIQELLEWWNVSLSSYNYLIKPKYPSNPYNKSLFHPIEIYRIIHICIIYNINIPKPLLYVLKNPRLLFKMYLGTMRYETDTMKKDSFMRKCFFSHNFIYNGGDPSNNIEGKWSLDKGNVNKSYITFMNSDLTDTNLYLLMCKMHNLIKYKKNIYMDIENDINDVENGIEHDTDNDAYNHLDDNLDDDLDDDLDNTDNGTDNETYNETYDANEYLSDANY